MFVTGSDFEAERFLSNVFVSSGIPDFASQGVEALIKRRIYVFIVY